MHTTTGPLSTKICNFFSSPCKSKLHTFEILTNTGGNLFLLQTSVYPLYTYLKPLEIPLYKMYSKASVGHPRNLFESNLKVKIFATFFYLLRIHHFHNHNL